MPLPHDPLGRYYTRQDIGDLAVSLVDLVSARRIVDLGCGHGALSVAARRRWRRAQITTVDRDWGAAEALADSLGAGHAHFHLDALHQDLPISLSLPDARGGGRRFDLAICNPPYVRPRWRREFARIIEEAGLDDAVAPMKHVTTDILFLAQNLRLLRDGGRASLIVPDGLVTGTRSVQLRRTILSAHHVRTVCALPRNAFTGTDARAHILVLEKAAPAGTAEVRVTELTPEGRLLQPVLVAAADAAERLDYGFHAHRLAAETRTTDRCWTNLRALRAEISRGRLPSGAARTLGAFHTTDFPARCSPRRIRLDRQRQPPAGMLPAVEARPGDILLARVDRNLADKVCMVTAGQAPLSDCVLRLRLAPAWREGVFQFLTSVRGREWLDAISKGVGARHLAAQDLLERPFPVPSGGPPS